MELSRQADYAVRAMVDLATWPAGTRVRTSEIAERQEIPESFLPRIVAMLSRAQLIQAFRGKDGGLLLARRANEISLLDIVRAVEGPICINRCTYNPIRCQRSSFCRVHPVWQKIQNYLDQVLGTTTLADLLESTPEAGMPLPDNQVTTIKLCTHSGELG